MDLNGGFIMSWWTHARDSVIKTATGGFIDPAGSRRQEQDAQAAMNAQIKAYQDQTALTREELARKQGEEKVEKRRVEEKQIRALRGSYRGAGGGLLGSQQSTQPDMSLKLGG
jgi:hypothetical protein